MREMFANAVLILGGNLGDRKELLRLAVNFISKMSRLTSVSAIYETQAWGNVAQKSFLNQVIEIETDFSPEKLLEHIHEIEQKLGRNRTEIWADRTMDIDILYFGDQVIDTPDLTVPHRYMAERKFVLVPLAEILPGFVHPILGKSTSELLESCKDPCQVTRFQEK
jgi:2-amino-4-hydroxy-6-hydroxymethyldihydropteridine diphosphokinase